MKLLMIYTKKFAFTPKVKTLESAEERSKTENFENVLTGFIHVEPEDEERGAAKTEKNLVKNLKWGARKNNADTIILHSFAHLATGKASAEFSKEVFNLAEKRLKNGNYNTAQTPFGYFLDLQIEAPGYSQARIFRSF